MGGSDNVTSDFLVIKVDALGNQQWQSSYDNNGNGDFITSIAANKDGSFVLGGTTTNPVTYESDILIVKMSATGIVEWTYQLIGNDYDGLESLQIDSKGNILVGGNSYSTIGGDKTENSRGDLDMWVVKLTGNGYKIWDKTIGGSATDLLAAIQVTATGDYLLCGYSFSNASGEKSEDSRGDMDWWVIRIDEDGSILWEKTLGGSSLDVATNLIETPSGEIVVVGYSNSLASGDKTQNPVNGPGDFDYWIIKLTSAGQKIWDKVYGGSDSCNGGGCWSEGAGEVAILNNGILIAGNSRSNANEIKSENNRGIDDIWYDVNKGTDDIWLIKIDDNGEILWDKTIGGVKEDFIFTNGNLVVDDSKVTFLANSQSDVSGDKTSPLLGTGGNFWLVSLEREAGDETTCSPSATMQKVVSFDQGKRKDGKNVSSQRSNPSNALGEANAKDSPCDGIQFVSLGFGGSITLEFDQPLCDKVGNDLRVFETSYGNPSFAHYPEQAEVLVSQDGNIWQTLGRTNTNNPSENCKVKLDTDFDINGVLTWIKFVRVVDVTNPDAYRRRITDCKQLPAQAFNKVSDGFDLDAVESLNDDKKNKWNAGRTLADNQKTESTLRTIPTAVIYPNPVEQELKIDLEEEEELAINEDVTVHLEIIDMKGIRLKTLNHNLDDGLVIRCDVSLLQPGIYFARTQQDRITRVYKFVKK